MKERPIPFSSENARAIFERRKTQTRRVVKMPRSRDALVLVERGKRWWPYQSDDGESLLCDDGCEHPYSSPYGQPGDRLWVREPWKTEFQFDGLPPRDVPRGSSIWYLSQWVEPERAGRYRHARFMPRWASHITLEVVSVRVERLQDISAEDARAEGCLLPDLPPEVKGVAGDYVADERTSFAILWNKINGPGAWAGNPWVWVVEFRRLESTGIKLASMPSQGQGSVVSPGADDAAR